MLRRDRPEVAGGLARRTRRAALPVLLLLAAAASAAEEPLAADLHEEVVRIPVRVKHFWSTRDEALTATTYRPDGPGPFPVVVLSHGSPVNEADRPRLGRWRKLPHVRALVQRHLAVVVPMRRGYGATGGDYAEGFGSCDAPDFRSAGAEAATDVLAAVAWATAQPWADPRTVLLIGHSAGGFASLAAASQEPRGVVGVVSFAGGRGGRPDRSPGLPCAPGFMGSTLRRWAPTIRVPVLWVYAENDRFFGPEHVRRWFEGFREAGGIGRLAMLPSFGKDGHLLFSAEAGIPIWTRELDVFLAELGVGARVEARDPAPGASP